MPRHVLWWYSADHHHRFPDLALLRGSLRALRAGFIPVYESGGLGGLHPPPALLHLHSGEHSADFDSKQDFVGTCIGIAVLTGGQLTQIYQQLRAHHSQDSHFLRRIRAEMAASDAYPWLCRCGRRNRKTMDYCPSCTRHCGELELQSSRTRRGAMLRGTRTKVAGMPHGYNPVPRPGRELQVQDSDSPRRIDARRTSRRWMHADGRTQSRGRGPAQQPLMLPPPPPLPTAPNWAHLQNIVPPSDPPAPVSTQESQQLKECVALLNKYEDGLPPEVQSYIQGIKAKDVKRSVKTLHSAVTSMG